MPRDTSQLPSSDHQRTVTGGCHCGAVRYKATIDVANLQPTKCNCSYCHKTNFVCITLDPDRPDALEFLSSSNSDAPAEAGPEPDADTHQAQYRFGSKGVIWYFCRTCGVTTLAQGEHESDAGDGKIVRVKTHVLNAVTLDQGQEGLDLSTIKFRYFNGLDHGWFASIQDSPAAWGTW